MTSWSISDTSLVFAKPVCNFEVVCFFSFSFSTRTICYSNTIFLALCFFFVACCKDHWSRSFSKDDTLCLLLNGYPFVGGRVGSSRTIERLIDRWCILAGRNARKKVASRKKDAIPKTGNRLAADLRGGRAVRESDATLLPADERSRPDSEVFFFIFGEVIGKKSSRKHPRKACDYPCSIKSFACSLNEFVPIFVSRDAIPSLRQFLNSVSLGAAEWQGN